MNKITVKMVDGVVFSINNQSNHSFVVENYNYTPCGNRNSQEFSIDSYGSYYHPDVEFIGTDTGHMDEEIKALLYLSKLLDKI